MAKQHSFISSVRLTFNWALFSLFFTTPLCAVELPPEFTASYDIEKFGFVVARSKYTLKHENNGVRLIQHTEPVGIVSLLRSDTLDENSFLSNQNDQLLLTEFSYKFKSTGKKNRNVKLKIDWIESEEKLLGNVTGTAHGEELNTQVNTPVWDTSSYQIPLMFNAKENAELQTHTMMVKGKFKTYSFITHGAEEININGKMIKTIKLERDSKPKNKPIFIWLAPELNNIPVKIEKWNDDDLELSLLLHEAKFRSDKTKIFSTDNETSKSIEMEDVKKAISELEDL